MPIETLRLFRIVRAVAPYLWGFAAAAALDRIVDVQWVALPAIAVAAAVNFASLIRWRARR